MSTKKAKFGALQDLATTIEQRGETPAPVETPLEVPKIEAAKLEAPIVGSRPERKLVSTRMPVDLHKRLKRYSLEIERDIEQILEELIEKHLRSEGF